MIWLHRQVERRTPNRHMTILTGIRLFPLFLPGWREAKGPEDPWNASYTPLPYTPTV